MKLSSRRIKAARPHCAKLLDVFGDLNGMTISVLGLAFKPNTNDMRSAPSLDVIPMLRSLGAKVKAFDPIAVPEAESFSAIKPFTAKICMRRFRIRMRASY
ncbi:UDP binding domain-containing protein [Bacillus licheniformis]|nr:UDP binding domain-containing protein [Bacillus licheniformis]